MKALWLVYVHQVNTKMSAFLERNVFVLNGTDNKKRLKPIQPSLIAFVMQTHTVVSESELNLLNYFHFTKV